MIRADLHIHSKRSDGSDTYEEILEKAILANLQVIAFTDHYIAPNLKRIDRLSDRGVCILPGIECTACDTDTRQKTHILGYGIQDYTPIDRVMEPVIDSLEENSMAQLEELQKLGYPITEEEARSCCEGPLYSQHISYVLYQKGVITEMFGEWRKKFQKDGPFAPSYYHPAPKAVVMAILEGGGLPVLAHPGQQQNFSLIPDLVRNGLAGLEYIHPSNSAADMKIIQECAHTYGLFLTGGSDSHGILSHSGGAIGEYIADASPLLSHLYKEDLI